MTRHTTNRPITLWTCVFVSAAAFALVGILGCEEPAGPVGPALCVGPTSQPDKGQKLFGTDDQAVAALVEAAKAKDHTRLHELFGPAAAAELISADKVQAEQSFEHFAQRVAEKVRLEKLGDSKTVLFLGASDWPFPIPVVKSAASKGAWFFDSAEGCQEILARRIGRNELATIEACRGFVMAQRDYAAKDRNGDGVLEYAGHFWSTPGTKDGLYWPTNSPDEEQSPAGPMVAAAAAKGYPTARGTEGPQPFNGYVFHILTRQGSAAPGGAYNYVINGRMFAGFALVAWPAKYGNTGIMTFCLSHQGVLHEKNLGPHTDSIVRGMTAYNPDKSWKKVTD
jgi:hypothetical protein